MGNYRVAHQQLLQFYKILKSQGKYVSPELLKQLMLLHSYNLVKTLIHINDHKYVKIQTFFPHIIELVQIIEN